ncbi:MAG: rRNA maturation RNase YbeY [Planctomycetes bacterium]|jgi:probable rRNA maturation factor|nr:rRNA maturation RNase YbeY [Planctomycetota bacterium]
MGVEIANRQRRMRLNKKEIAALALKTITMEKADGHVSIVFVGRSKIIELNERYLKSNGTTDVIAFPLQDDLHEDQDYLGEVVVCTDVADDEAKARGIDPTEELYYYTVHGLLHILGHTDQDPAARRKMNKRARAILTAFLKDAGK